ncbi:lipase family protein [Agromyces seonyuensis]|uniref:Triacylglycerol lipase n=1 Tax=Agromyces seonyuensis TaxID=2662446 RepID=A0A6I4NYE1_9MICO|nr:lipase family protein [Agromyces seonyuensis]MWB99390.1 triacylglycerol lipase [Agromyces seonyuensis]
MRRTVRIAVLGALTALVAGLAVAAPAQAAGSFYDPPADLPGANGALVKTAPMKLAVQVKTGASTAPLPATATQIMYESTDADGNAVAVTGTYLEPSGSWREGGPRPLVSFAAGTQGQGDGCAPSQTLQQGLVFDSESIAIGYEIPQIYAFLARGIAVVVTDYIGLGMSDRVHSYVVRLDSGHAVLDAARAAKQVPGASVTDASPIGLYGYSQGGGATASAAELAPTYAPELSLKAAHAGAPPADLMEVMKSADGTAIMGVIGFALNGLSQYEPEMQAALAAEITPQGQATLASLSTQCIGDLILRSGTAFTRTSSWTTSGQSLHDLAQRVPAAKAAVDAQKIGRLTPAIPVQIVTGTKDDIVAHGQARQLAVDWCRAGVDVDYDPVIQLASSGGTALNHLGPAITRGAFSRAWLVDRMLGRPWIDDCALIRLQP